MFRDDFNPYVSERRAQAWWPPPFDVPETIKQLEIWRSTSNVQLFGTVKDGRRWHRSAGEEFLADYEGVVMAWVSRKLDSRASLTTKSVFASPLRRSESSEGTARSDDETLLTVRALFAQDPFGESVDGLDKTGRQLLTIHRGTRYVPACAVSFRSLCGVDRHREAAERRSPQ